MPDDSAPQQDTRSLADLRNIGKAALADFAVLDIQTVEQLAEREPDALYLALCQKTLQRHDPCVHDVFAAAIHQARTGEALNWWRFTPDRKIRQQNGIFPVYESAAPER
ncbi:helix-hairpin-helix domain-containing protein [Acetobacter cerevisiae]|uniref:Helix-hairpin-helix domain-containing protein n=1 Tax=Acetobacter cerevisiae TaxID=178900 RepID=A0A149UVH5_9PROT|nr:helix-hairpin-helix domain-containing protein [Acetobacter cerevisiae]KXV71942.1 Mitomycin resistance protein mcrB [Acetobacter cerevisiae]MCP1245573.1 helix-hairpin-helix domain-containing protein [Acetobacter cerevisiae]MCP1255281.1 helix-hairpin-helix domain-containing protein [Acetobacter cerevisiae]